MEVDDFVAQHGELGRVLDDDEALSCGDLGQVDRRGEVLVDEDNRPVDGTGPGGGVLRA